MLSTHRWRSPLALAGFTLLSACGIFDPSGLETVVTLDDSLLGPDDTMIISVETTNFSAESVEIAGQPCPPAFEVLNSDGEVVAPGPTLCPLALFAPVRLAQGESHTATYQWVGDGAPDGMRLPRGTYRLRAWTDALIEGPQYGRDHRIFVN